MMYFLVKYIFEVKTGKSNIYLDCAEIMDEYQRHDALEYIDSVGILSVKVDVGENSTKKIWIDVNEVQEAIDNALEINKQDYESFKRMFDGTSFGKICWEDIRCLIESEIANYN